MKALRTLVAAAALAALLTPAAGATPPQTTEFGSGPTIVIVHDLGGSRLTWMPTAKKLLAGHRVVLADLPGHGDTPLPDPFSLEASAAMLDELLARQNAASTVLVGKGMGGLVAMMAAQAHPERVRGVVVIDAALKMPMPVQDQQMKRFFEWVDGNYDQFLKMTFGRLGSDSLQNVAIHAQAAQVPAVTIKSYMKAGMTADAWRAVKGMRVPLLFIGTDRVLGKEDWATAAKKIGYDEPGLVPVRHLRNCGYLAMQEQPDSLAAAIREFTARSIATAAK